VFISLIPFGSTRTEPGSRTASKGRQRPRPLTLTIRGTALTFATPEDFAFCVRSRSCVPARRFEASLQQAPDDLWREAEDIKKVEKQIVAILEQSRRSDSPCGPAIRGLNPKLFSNDQDWRAIFGVVVGLGDEYDEYQRIALTKYLQYLGARQEILRLAYAIRNRGSGAEQGPTEDIDPADRIKATVIFEAGQNADDKRLLNPFQRLPQGEPTRVRLVQGQPMEILLAKARFSLACDGAWVLTDSAGHRFPLHPGRNTVGRSRHNDISLDCDFRDISRCHLVMEPEAGGVILLTDLSSHGTFVPPANVDPR
jgi:hypothetical protein